MCGSGSTDHDDVDSTANELNRQRRDPVDLALRVTVFDEDVATIDVAKVTKAFAECVEERIGGAALADHADPGGLCQWLGSGSER